MPRVFLNVTADMDSIDDVKLKFTKEFHGLYPIARADLLRDLLFEVQQEYEKARHETFPETEGASN